MRRRVIGIETEYGVTVASPSGRVPSLDVDAAARLLFEPVAAGGRAPNLFLRNGGRLYLDVGSHPEYATAECDRLDDLLAQNRAGDAMLVALADRAHERMHPSAPGASPMGAEGERIYLFRNNVDSQGNSYGCHENYLLHRRRDFRQVADALVSFFITRQILVGAGHIRLRGGSPVYCFSQRAEHMWDAVSSATTRSRPIINTRDEPLADSGSYRRMHVIVGDTNVAEPTTLLKAGATRLLLTALEDGLHIEDLAVADPMIAIREINQDISGRHPVELITGRHATAADIQREIRERVLVTLDASELDDFDHYVIDLWGRGIEAISSGDWTPVETELDVAIKKKLLDGYVARTGVSLGDARVARLMLSYHDIGATGLRERMERSGLMRRVTSVEQVERAMTWAPQTTRAHLRGRVIAAAEATGTEISVDWVHARMSDRPTLSVSLHDPFATEDPAVDDLIRMMTPSSPLIPA